MILNIYNNYKTLIHNVFYMNIVKVIVLVVPLLVYPYLIKTVGLDSFGLVIWIWAIIDLLIIFVNFGFEISITKHISMYRDSKVKLSKIFTSVLYLKLLFYFIVLTIVYLLFISIDQLNNNRDLFIYSTLIIIPEIFMPLWYFRGIEKMQFVALLTTSTKIMFAISIFVIIKKPDDFILIPILYAISGMISALVANYILIVKENIKIKKISIKRMYSYYKESLPLFASNSVYIIREKASIIFIERFFGLSFVAYWDLVIKIINIFTMGFQIVSSSFYPYMAKVKNLPILFKVMFFTVMLSIIVIILINVFSEEIINIIFENYNTNIIEMLEILSITIILNLISAFFGLNILSIYSENTKYFLSTLYATILYFVVFYFILYLNLEISIYLFTMISVLTIATEMIIRILFSIPIIKKYWNN
jgi:O-antigen/teichoic acid export membrane protein